MNHADVENRKNYLLSVILLLQIIFFIICITMIGNQIADYRNSGAEGKRTECFASVRVRSGDTLWKISSRYYSDEYKNMHFYMKRIMELNNMPDEEIYTGSYVIIPYYEPANFEKE